MIHSAVVSLVLGVVLTGGAAQSAVTAGDTLVDILVFGLVVPGVDLNAYPQDVRQPLEGLLQRAKGYVSRRPRPPGPSLESMVYEARVRYERLLVAFADDPTSQALAASYVDRLTPCYEWEGYHDCPEEEALFAADYLKTNPTAPFREFLPLLAAHRWLCTAEAYGYEKRPADAARSRRAHEDAIATARQSSDVLVRAGAEALMVRGHCLAR